MLIDYRICSCYRLILQLVRQWVATPCLSAQNVFIGIHVLCYVEIGRDSYIFQQPPPFDVWTNKQSQPRDIMYRRMSVVAWAEYCFLLKLGEGKTSFLSFHCFLCALTLLREIISYTHDPLLSIEKIYTRTISSCGWSWTQLPNLRTHNWCLAANYNYRSVEKLDKQI